MTGEFEEITLEESGRSKWRKEKTVKTYLIGEFEDGNKVRVYENITDKVRIRVRVFERYAYLSIEVQEDE
jgi:hypothetical protein